jgi:hypothetical protein
MPCDKKLIIIKKLISIYINLPISRKASTGFGTKYTYERLFVPMLQSPFLSFWGPPPSICLRGLVIFRTIRFLLSQYSVLQHVHKNTVDLSVNGMNTLKVMYNGKWCGFRRWTTLGIVLGPRRSLNICCLLFCDIFPFPLTAAKFYRHFL